MGISVLMSVYRKEQPQYLREALESMLNQTRMPDEIVLIKDGPLAEELELVIKEVSDRYDKLVTYQFKQNVKLGRALAKGVQLCSNELIARMDSDDVAVPERLEWQYDFMQVHKEIAVCGGWVEEFNDSHSYESIKKMPEQSKELLRFARYRNPLNHMTVMFRKEKVLEYGNYEHFPLLEDYDLWSRMLTGGEQFYNLQEVLVHARTNEGIYDRRGGWTYFKCYVQLRKRQKERGQLSRAEYITALAMSFTITMIPGKVRKWIYRYLLRR